MIWFAFLLLAFAVFAGIYCSVMYNRLYRNGIVKQEGRVSLGKLNLALADAQSRQDHRLINRCRRWYGIYVLAFFAAVIQGVVCVIVVFRP
jgi:hypothetical protein